MILLIKKFFFFLDKTQLYFGSVIIYYYSCKPCINSTWSVGQQLGNNLKKHKKGLTLGDTELAGERGGYQEPQDTIETSEVLHYTFILLKILKKNLAVDQWQSQLSTICISFMN